MPNELPRELKDINILLSGTEQFATLQQLQAMSENLNVFEYNHQDIETFKSYLLQLIASPQAEVAAAAISLINRHFIEPNTHQGEDGYEFTLKEPIDNEKIITNMPFVAFLKYLENILPAPLRNQAQVTQFFTSAAPASEAEILNEACVLLGYTLQVLIAQTEIKRLNSNCASLCQRIAKAVPLITDNKACETLLSFMCTHLYSNQATWNDINISRLTTYLLEAENTINKQGILVALNDIDLKNMLNINELISPAIINACFYALHDTDLLTSNLAAQFLFMIGENLENNHLHHYLDDLDSDTLERFTSSMASEEAFIDEKAAELTALLQQESDENAPLAKVGVYENNFAALAGWLASRKAETTSTSAMGLSPN